jgi:hypothetical protein
MWEHYCQVEHSEMMIGHGEQCSWCGATDPSHYQHEETETNEFLVTNDSQPTLRAGTASAV